MKKVLIIALALMAVVSTDVMAQKSTIKAAPTVAAPQMIQTPIPLREKGQKDMLQFAAKPMPTIRVACIGLGMRGPGA
ncbi:MAG: glycosyl hydrolase, partial [Mucinivorans sp.]